MDDYTAGDAGFRDFMKRVDQVVVRRFALGVFDFADAPWRDLYDVLGVFDFADVPWRDLYDENPDATDQEIIEHLAEWDDLAAEMLRD